MVVCRCAVVIRWGDSMRRVFIFQFLFIALFASALWAKAKATRTFENAGLKNKHVVTLSQSDDTISGVYVVKPYEDSEKESKRSFTGVKVAKKPGQWKISFKGGAPYEVAPGTKNVIWRLGVRDKKDVLIVLTYGKNYETGKYAAYEMVFVRVGR